MRSATVILSEFVLLVNIIFKILFCISDLIIMLNSHRHFSIPKTDYYLEPVADTVGIEV